jgi:hypothetical protein
VRAGGSTYRVIQPGGAERAHRTKSDLAGITTMMTPAAARAIIGACTDLHPSPRLGPTVPRARDSSLASPCASGGRAARSASPSHATSSDTGSSRRVLVSSFARRTEASSSTPTTRCRIVSDAKAPPATARQPIRATHARIRASSTSIGNAPAPRISSWKARMSNRSPSACLASSRSRKIVSWPTLYASA